MAIIEKWNSMYVYANPDRKTCCVVCGKPARYIDIFTERAICSRECAMKHNEKMYKLTREAENKYPACPE